MTEYGKVCWTVEDILSIRPKWTEQQAQDWLDKNNLHIEDRLIELGWQVIEDLIHFDEYNEKNPEL